ncbi:MAG: BMP family lipoprotein [Anaerolineae bacterium]|jgi:simple sugar transport system substrate-binding protein
MLRKRTLWTMVSLMILVSLFVTACQNTATSSGGAEDEELVFGVILVGPYNDHGWSEAHYNGALYAQERIPGARMVYLDKLNPADRQGTTLEQVVDDMVGDGARIILTTSDDFRADTHVVAAKYPDVAFVHISGDGAKTGEAPENVANFMSKMEYMKAVGGCAAALKTETGAIGYLGPVINEETRRLAASAYLGARDCYERYRGGNPDDLRFVVTWIGFWFNIPGVTLDPTNVANDLFNSGVDVILSGIDTTEAIVVAGQRADQGDNVWAIPYDYEGACEIKPEVCLGTPYFNWGPTYVEILESIRNGTFEQTWVWADPYWADINDHDRSPVGYRFGDALTEDEITILEEYIDDLGTGNAKLFVGPLNLQDGTEYLADGQEATDDEIWYLPQLLEGMEGASN